MRKTFIAGAAALALATAGCGAASQPSQTEPAAEAPVHSKIVDQDGVRADAKEICSAYADQMHTADQLDKFVTEYAARFQPGSQMSAEAGCIEGLTP